MNHFIVVINPPRQQLNTPKPCVALAWDCPQLVPKSICRLARPAPASNTLQPNESFIIWSSFVLNYAGVNRLCPVTCISSNRKLPLIWHKSSLKHSSLLLSVFSPQSSLILCNPMGCSPPGSSVYGILQARIPEWVVTSSSRGSSWPRCRTLISRGSCIGGQALYHWATRQAAETFQGFLRGIWGQQHWSPGRRWIHITGRKGKSLLNGQHH